MRLRFCETDVFLASPAIVWAALADVAGMVSFTGYGPIPGIARARWIEGDAYGVGAVREVENLDGSRHREDVIAACAPTLLEDRIYGFTSPLRLLVREARDRFELEPIADCTALRRTLMLELISPLCLPLAALLVPLLRRACRRHHASLGSQFARSSVSA